MATILQQGFTPDWWRSILQAHNARESWDEDWSEKYHLANQKKQRRPHNDFPGRGGQLSERKMAKIRVESENLARNDQFPTHPSP